MRVGQYQIIEEIGAGGMGVVYRAKDSSDKLYAIKQLKASLTNPEILERFQREGQALRELNHPNIVKMLEMLEDDGKHYLVLEYIQGGDLNQVIEKQVIPIETTLKFAIDIADALTRAHKLNIIHRDLKPANILLAEDGTVRLTDFGVAQFGRMKQVTEAGVAVGTLDYMSPEAFSGDEVDNRADIWSFGVMLFEMLSRKRPFGATTITQTVSNILMHPVPDLEELRPDAPIDLIDLVYRMLEKDRQSRISSIRHVGAALEDILQGRSARFDTPVSVIYHRPKHNLPAETSEFVGREEELAELARLLNEPHCRLITIMAAGGMGKSRLSLAAAKDALLNFADGVYFIELAKLTEVESILPAIASAAGYEFQKDEREKKQQLLEFLSNKQMLLVFDNYEHLLEGAGIVAEILKAAPDVKIIVTSRQRINQEGETLFHLSGMDFPSWETPSDALHYAAVKLFLNSAKRAKPGFELNETNLDTVARICRLVAGMPLGIVLAAAWLGTLSIQEIAEELTQGIDFLEANGGALPERQRSIRVVMEYSWKLMSESEQAVFRKFAIFRGGFSRKAAESITGANLRLMMSLVNKSLLRRDNNSDRYEIHELLRQYAEEELEASGEIDAVRDAHSAYYLKFVAERLAYFHDYREAQASEEIDKDFENLRAAWFWGLQTKQSDKLAAAVESLYCYGDIRGLNKELLLWVQAASTKISAAGEIDSLSYGNLLVHQTAYEYQTAEDSEAQVLAEKHLEAALAIGDKHQSDYLLYNAKKLLADSQAQKGNYQKLISLALEVQKHAQALNSPYYIADSLQYYSYAIHFLDEWDKLAEITQKTYELFKELGNQSRIVAIVSNLGVLAFSEGDYEKAESYAREALAMVQKGGNKSFIIEQQLRLADALYDQGQLEEAETMIRNAYQLTQDLNLKEMQIYARTLLSSVLGARGKYDESLALAYQVYDFQKWNQDALHGYLHGPLGRAGNLAEMRKFLEKYLPKLPPRDFHILPHKMTLLFNLLPLIQVDWGTARATECLSLLFNYPKSSSVFGIHAFSLKCREEYEAELGKEAFEVAWEHGKSLNLDKLIEEIRQSYAQAKTDD